MRGGEEWMYFHPIFTTRSPGLDQNFCGFSEVPWLFHDLNWAETKFWAKMEEMVSDVSVKTSIFQLCSFMNSLIYSGTFREERKGLSHLLMQTGNFWGGEGKTKVLEKRWEGREREACPLCTLCVLGFSRTELLIMLKQIMPFIS